jgi:hypothetical protein
MDYHKFVKQFGKRAWSMCVVAQVPGRASLNEWLRRAYPSKTAKWREDAMQHIYATHRQVHSERMHRRSRRPFLQSALPDRLWRYVHNHAYNLVSPGVKHYRHGTMLHFTRVNSLDMCRIEVSHGEEWSHYRRRSYARKTVTYGCSILRGMTRLRELIPDCHHCYRKWGVLGAVERGYLYGYPALDAVIVTPTRDGSAARKAIIVCNGDKTTACADIKSALGCAYKMRCVSVLEKEMEDAWSAALASRDKFLEKSLLLVANERVSAMEPEVLCGSA